MLFPIFDWRQQVLARDVSFFDVLIMSDFAGDEVREKQCVVSCLWR